MGYFLSFINKNGSFFFPSRTKLGYFDEAGFSIRICQKTEVSDTNFFSCLRGVVFFPIYELLR